MHATLLVNDLADMGNQLCLGDGAAR